MTQPHQDDRLLLAVTATEWRNLCARGSMRVQSARIAVASSTPTEAQLFSAFSASPTTKPESSVDTFVLELRNDWPATARTHDWNDSVSILELDQVVSHHLVAEQDRNYYAPQAEGAGVALASDTYEPAWRAWIATEETDAALRAAVQLAGDHGIDLSTSMERWRPLARAVATRNFRSPDLPSNVRTLLQAATKIDDAAASVRTTQAYWVVTALEWVDASTGTFLLDAGSAVPPHKIDWGISWGKRAHWEGQMNRMVSNALKTIQSAAPEAFTEGISAATVGHIVRLLVESRHGTPEPSSVTAALNSTSSSPDEAALICVLASAALGPELVRQLRINLCAS